MTRAVLAAAGYFLLAWMGYRFEVVPAHVVIVWPPAGFMLAVLLLSPRRAWPALVAGGFAGNLAADLLHGSAPEVVFAAAAANLVETVVAALAATRLAGGPVRLNRLQDVFALVVGAAIVSNAVTALLGALVLAFGSGMPFRTGWFVWGTGDGLGMLIVAPALIAWSDPALRRRRVTMALAIEAAALAAAIVVLAQISLGSPENLAVALHVEPYMLLPLLLWAALRFGPPGATAATLALAAVTVWNAANGRIYFLEPGQSPMNYVVRVAAYLGVASLTALVAAAILSEREAATDALAAANERTRFAMEAAKAGVWEADLVTGTIAWSETMSLVHGFPASEFRGTVEHLMACIHPDDRSGMAAQMEKHARDGGAFTFELRTIWPDGSIHWMEAVGRVIADDTGSNVRVLGVARDTTESHRVADERRHLAAILEVTPDFVTIGVSDASPLFMNRAIRTALGLAPDESSSSLYNHRLKSFRRRFEQVILPLARANGSWRGDAEYVARDGRVIPVSQVTIVHTDEEGREIISTIARDISALRRSTLELTRLGAAIHAAHDAIFVTDCDGLIIFVNPAFTRLYGYTAEEVVGRATPRILKSGTHPPDHYVRLWQELLAGGEVSAEHVNRAKDGRLVTVAASASPITGTTGERVGFVAIQRDLTAQKLAEEQLRHAQKMEAVGHLAAGVAHDFNNVLTSVLGYASLLAEAPETTDAQRADAAEIVHAAERAAGLTRQLLMFSRRQRTERVPLRVEPVIEDLRRMLQRTIGDEIAIVLRFNAAESIVKADKTEIEQVLLNLAVNARDAMPTGGTLTVSTDVVGPHLRIAVADTGEGISPEIRVRLFEPFFTTKPVGKGTGLGLATVHGIVTESGGRVDIVSELGHGATFGIYLPLLENATAEAGSAVRMDGARGGHETILVVDDDPAIVAMMKRVFERVGYRTLTAGGVAEALIVARRHAGTIDLLVTDVVMPRAGGIELASRLTERQPHLRVMFVSGYPGEAADRWQMDLAVRAHFVAKPFARERLLAEVRAALDAA